MSWAGLVTRVMEEPAVLVPLAPSRPLPVHPLPGGGSCPAETCAHLNGHSCPSKKVTAPLWQLQVLQGLPPPPALLLAQSGGRPPLRTHIWPHPCRLSLT